VIINIDKPAGWSSFDVVKKVKRITRYKKVGHGGTLDPFATGVLIIGTESDTKKLTEITNFVKAYQVELVLGKTTNTLDTEGEVVFRKKIPDIDSELIKSILNKFLGKQKQKPPMFSAKKHKGVRLYKLARKNIEVKRDDIDIFIHNIELVNFTNNNIRFIVECSKGTYIRVLGKDIAKKLNTVGYLSALKRTKVGDYLIDDSLSIDEFEDKWKSTDH
tara:strand:- start:1212 stop:1865 length:654 start_codon:yes stop_codon:yes gene_type:complete